ncbi:helix-turn-helix transcriptional regulator [Nocardia blacklockiae]|uniref:helix-turn-helix transcriptional regulator n=1 Tax=Nocardia blacklockiae TaxID=480036 RepID=UPI0018936C34|nr:AraC family transcriptional regulator [Nocardia blacklockiae]MBF6172223.1 helix-turn-helix transcriptional regulator [Nocardia blacklockiae]
MRASTRVVGHRGGVPVYDYRADHLTPPVSLLRFESFEGHTMVMREGAEPGERREVWPHIHDFPALFYAAEAAVVYVIGAGQVVDVEAARTVGDGVGVFFDPAVLDDGRTPWPAWRSHPLLFPFLHGRSSGLLRLEVPADRRARWDDAIAAIETELAERQEGYRQAAAAHLTLLLIELARLAADVVGDLRRSGEPLLAEVFDVIERRHGEPLSLRDVARAVGMTPGHLTTVVRRRTGRTVQDWIADRRMTEARQLLAETDLPIAEIARRVGVPDPGYFTRLFRRTHGEPPRRWRDRVAEAS